MKFSTYKSIPITISEKQLQAFIINLDNAKINCQKAKDQVPYDRGNIMLHSRLSTVRMILDAMSDDLQYMIQNLDSQLSGE